MEIVTFDKADYQNRPASRLVESFSHRGPTWQHVLEFTYESYEDSNVIGTAECQAEASVSVLLQVLANSGQALWASYDAKQRLGQSTDSDPGAAKRTVTQGVFCLPRSTEQSLRTVAVPIPCTESCQTLRARRSKH